MSDLCYREVFGWIEFTDSIDHRALKFEEFWDALAARDLDRVWRLLDEAWMVGTILPFAPPADIQALQVPDEIRGKGSRYRVWLLYPDLSGGEEGPRRQDWSPDRG